MNPEPGPGRSWNCPCWLNSLAPGKFEWNFRYVIFKWILVIDGWGISCEIVLIWMSLDFTDDQSTLVQVMAWCRLATSHYLNQCWPRSLSPYGTTRPQCVNSQSAAILPEISSSNSNDLVWLSKNIQKSLIRNLQRKKADQHCCQLHICLLPNMISAWTSVSTTMANFGLLVKENPSVLHTAFSQKYMKSGDFVCF